MSEQSQIVEHKMANTPGELLQCDGSLDPYQVRSVLAELALKVDALHQVAACGSLNDENRYCVYNL